MSRHYITQDEYHWQIGYDNPGQGFYALRFVNWDTDDEEADVLIGFGRGVPLSELALRCESHGLILSVELRAQLRIDQENETRPLTPLQELISNLAIQAGAWEDSPHADEP